MIKVKTQGGLGEQKYHHVTDECCEIFMSSHYDPTLATDVLAMKFRIE